MKTAKSVYDWLKDFMDGMSNRRIGSFAAAGAYFLFVSLVPLVMIFCALLQYTPLTEELVLAVISEYVPQSLYVIVSRIVSMVYRSGSTALTVSVLLTAWSASASMKAMMHGMDAVYNVERNENYLIFSLRAFLYMIIFVGVVMLSLIVMVYGGKILNLVRNCLPVSDAVDYFFHILKYLRFLVVMGLLAIVFMPLYRWMPAVKMPYRYLPTGAAFTAVVWVVFSSAFSFYISLSNKWGAYGFIGTIMVAMMWMYYCIYFLFIGGYLNRYLYLRYGGKIPDEK